MPAQKGAGEKLTVPSLPVRAARVGILVSVMSYALIADWLNTHRLSQYPCASLDEL